MEKNTKTLKDYQKAGQALYDKLHLATYPVAISYIQTEKDIPEGVMRPSVFGKKMALCQAFTQARRWGVSVAMTADDNFCTPATGFHQWVNISREDLIESQVRQGWHKDAEAEKIRINAFFDFLGEKGIERLRRYCGFVCSPLHESLIVPDTVLVYGDGVQLTHLIHALSYEYKHVPFSFFEGFAESCFKGGLLPHITGKPQVVLPGAGDRSFAAICEHEIGIGVPGPLVFYLLEHLFKTGGGMNIGYPSRTLLPMDLDETITPGFQFLREKIEKIKNK